MSRSPVSWNSAVEALGVATAYVRDPKHLSLTCRALNTTVHESFIAWLLLQQQSGLITAYDAMELAVRNAHLGAMQAVYDRNDENLPLSNMLVKAAGQPHIIEWLLTVMPRADVELDASNLFIAAVRKGCARSAMIAHQFGAAKGWKTEWDIMTALTAATSEVGIRLAIGFRSTTDWTRSIKTVVDDAHSWKGTSR
jgi:hypothetical protein